MIQLKSSPWDQILLSLCPVWDSQLETDKRNPMQNRGRGRQWSKWNKHNSWRKNKCIKRVNILYKVSVLMVSLVFTQIVLWAQSKQLLDPLNLLSISHCQFPTCCWYPLQNKEWAPTTVLPLLMGQKLSHQKVAPKQEFGNADLIILGQLLFRHLCWSPG